MHIHNTYIEKGNKSIRLNKKDRRSSRSKTTIIRKKINKKKEISNQFPQALVVDLESIMNNFLAYFFAVVIGFASRICI